MVFEVKIGNNTLSHTRLWYDIYLNEINQFEVFLDGVTSFERTNYTNGTVTEIYRDGTLEFSGVITGRVSSKGGGFVIRGVGEEVDLARSQSTPTTWKATASATIFPLLITMSSKFSAGTIDAGETVDHKISGIQSPYNSFLELLHKTNQDSQVDYANHEIDVLDSLGSSQLTMNEETGDIRNVRYEDREPFLKVIVYGKGDGAEQITATATDGSYSAGDPIKKITDPTIISTSEAQKRADQELIKWSTAIKIYDFEVVDITRDIGIGDTFELNSESAGVSGDTVRVVKVRRGEKGGSEYLEVQVVNSEYSSSVRAANHELIRLERIMRDSNGVMQGSGNYNTWGKGINANNSIPLKVHFNLPAALIEDEAGTIRATSFLVDYDVDKFNEQYGGATFTGSDPQVQNDSGNTQPDVSGNAGSNDAGVSGTTANSGTPTWSTSYSGGSAAGSPVTGTVTDAAWTTITSQGVSVDTDLVLYWILLENDNAALSREILIRVYDGTTYWPSSSGLVVKLDAGDRICVPVFFPANLNGKTLYAYIKSVSGDMDFEAYWAWQSIGKHTHADGSLAADSHLHSDGSLTSDNHGHPDGTYDVNAADLDHISIGDNVNEASSINASQVSIYLDYYDPLDGAADADGFVNKHSVLNTGKLIDSDVDISDGGTYPDATGTWRVRILTDSANADFVQGIVKLKNSIDN